MPSPLHGMDQVPVTVGLAVRVQPVLQELLLGAVLQAEQVVHVLLSKQTRQEERPLPTVTASCGCAGWLWFGDRKPPDRGRRNRHAQASVETTDPLGGQKEAI